MSSRAWAKPGEARRKTKRQIRGVSIEVGPASRAGLRAAKNTCFAGKCRSARDTYDSLCVVAFNEIVVYLEDRELTDVILSASEQLIPSVGRAVQNSVQQRFEFQNVVDRFDSRLHIGVGSAELTRATSKQHRACLA